MRIPSHKYRRCPARQKLKSLSKSTLHAAATKRPGSRQHPLKSPVTVTISRAENSKSNLSARVLLQPRPDFWVIGLSKKRKCSVLTRAQHSLPARSESDDVTPKPTTRFTKRMRIPTNLRDISSPVKKSSFQEQVQSLAKATWNASTDKPRSQRKLQSSPTATITKSRAYHTKPSPLMLLGRQQQSRSRKRVVVPQKPTTTTTTTTTPHLSVSQKLQMRSRTPTSATKERGCTSPRKRPKVATTMLPYSARSRGETAGRGKPRGSSFGLQANAAKDDADDSSFAPGSNDSESTSTRHTARENSLSPPPPARRHHSQRWPTNENHAMLLRSNEKPHAAPQRSRPQLGEASYTLLFHDDGTGRKPVAAYTFNFALELMKTEAETAARVCPVAEEEDVVVTAKRDPATRKRNFRVAADRHCQTILERVRQRLRRIQLPVQYARVGSADVGEAQGLAATNHQRRTDLEQSSRRLLDQLQQQRAQLERQWRALATQKEQWQQTLATTVTADRHRRHPLLRSLRRLPPGDDQNESQPPNHHNDRAYRRWAPAPPGTMTRLCEALLRLPDHHEKTASQPHPDGTR